MADLEKDEFLEILEKKRPDLMYPEAWNEDKVKLADDTLAAVKPINYMMASIPMICKGDRCPQKESCELYKKGIPPVGKKCPYEIILIQSFKDALVESLGINQDDFTEMSQLRAMIDQEIQYIRKSNYLAEEGFIMENVVGISDAGEPITKKELSLAVELEDRIHKRLKDYRSQLLATREARQKVLQGDINSAKSVASILAKIKEVNEVKELEMKKELGTYIRDEYITDAEIIDEG